VIGTMFRFSATRPVEVFVILANTGGSVASARQIGTLWTFWTFGAFERVELLNYGRLDTLIPLKK